MKLGKSGKWSAIAGLLCMGLLFGSCGTEKAGAADQSSETEAEVSEAAAGESTGNEFHMTVQNGFAEETADSQETKTIMIYMMGSDLEAGGAAATEDMQEMLDHQPDPDRVQVLICTGGSKKWHNGVPSDANMVYQLVEEGFSPVTEFDSKSMGEPEALTEFLEYGYENYPAETYNLIFWDHGNGPLEGYGKDILYDNDAMELTELRQALEDSPFGTKQKFSFIGFDACLMSSVELACMLSEYSEYLIASQEVEPSYGWNYSFLTDAAEKTTEQLICEIIESYLNYNEEYFQENENVRSEVTLAAVDLSMTGLLEEQLNSMFKEAGRDMSGDYVSLAYDRVQTRAFGRASTGSEYDLVDVDALMTAMAGEYDQETAGIQELLEKMVVCNGSNTEESCGVSLYYPFYNKSYYRKSWGNEYGKLGVLTDYADYLEKYSAVWLSTDMKDYFEGTLTAETEDNAVYTLQLSDEQAERYADGAYYILRRSNDSGNLYNLVYVSNGVTFENGKLTADYDGKAIYGTTDYGYSFIPLLRQWDTIDNETRYTAYPRFWGSFDQMYEGGQEAVDGRIHLSLDRESGEVSITDVVEPPEEGQTLASGKLSKINMDDYAHAIFSRPMAYLTRDEEGRILDFWDWEDSSFIKWETINLADGLHFSYEPLYDDGQEYYLMFRVTDVQGNIYCSEPLPLLPEDAPSSSEAETGTEISWEAGSSVEILKKDGVILTLFLCEKKQSTPVWILQVENENPFKVEIEVSDITVNEEAYQYGFTGITVEAESTSEEKIQDIAKLCSGLGIEMPDALTFRCKLINRETDGYMEAPEQIILKIGDSVKPAAEFIEINGAKAEEQQLLDEKGLQVILQGFGKELAEADNSYYKTILLRVENTSPEEQTLNLLGAAVNGCYVLEETDGSLTLDTGQSGYLEDTIAAALAETEEEKVTSVTYYFQIDENYYVCPIVLESDDSMVEEGSPDTSDEKSVNTFYSYDGERETVYADDNVRIYRGNLTVDDYDSVDLNLWVENQTKDFLAFRLKSLETDEGVLVGDDNDDEIQEFLYRFHSDVLIPPHTWTQIQIPFEIDKTPDSAELNYEWLRQGTDEIVGTSGIMSVELEENYENEE